MPEYSVIVTDHDFEDLSIERAVLGDIATIEDCTASVGETDADEETFRNADAVLNLRATLGADRIALLERCQVIARYGIGVDNVDTEAATEAGIRVTNVPEYCIEEVATHAMALGLALLRGIKRYDAAVADGAWSRGTVEELRRVSELTVGVVGYGAIERAVGTRAAAFGADVVASDPYLEAADLKDGPGTLVSFEDLLSRAHLVTIHSPLTPETRGLFDTGTFKRMRDDAVLVNVARGPVVDDDALFAALETDSLAGAALDVFPEEPPAADHPLRDHPRVLTTPHVAWYSQEANDERRRKAAETVRAALEGDPVENVVNGVES